MTTNIASLQVFDSIKAAWEKVGGVKATFWAGLLCVFVVYVGLILVQMLTESLGGGFALGAISGIAKIALQIVLLLLFVGLTYLGVLHTRGVPIQFNMLGYVFNGATALRLVGVYLLKMIFFVPLIVLMFLPMIIAFVMALGASAEATEPSLAVAGAFSAGSVIVAIVGGVILLYLMIRMLYAELAVVAQQMGPWTAIKYSFKMTKGNFWKLFGLLIMNMLIYIVSIMTLGILLIWTFPYFFINFGLVYDTLSKQADQSA